MVEVSSLSEKIFSLLKGHGLKVKIFDDAGNETTDPTAARRFFVVNPNIMVTVDEDAKKVEFSKGKNVDDSVEGIQKGIRKLSDQFMMNSQIKIFGKSIQPKDYAYQAKMKGAAMMENTQADLIHRVLERLRTSPGTEADTMAQIFGIDVREIKPVLIRLVKERKIIAEPGFQDGQVLYSLANGAMMENATSPHNHHLVGEVIRMIKAFTSKNHQHHQPNGAAFHDICNNLGEEPDEVQPILNKLVQQGKVVAHPYKDYMIYSMAVDEAIYEESETLKRIRIERERDSDKNDARWERNYQRGHELKKINTLGRYHPDQISAMTGNQVNKPGSPAARKNNSIDGSDTEISGKKPPITPPSASGKKFNTSRATDIDFKDIPVNESFSKMFGSLRTSQQTLENVRILVRHKTPIDENVRGSRSRHISAIFLECNGERFRFPHNYLPGARAMAQHMAHSGTFSDKVGEYITETTGNLLKLQSFNRYVTTNKLINEDSSGIVETVKENIETIRTELKKLTGVKTYETVKARLETFEREALAEDDTSQLKELFTIRRFDEKFEGVLPIIKQLVQEKDTYHKRIEESAANVVKVRRESINTTPMFEFASENARLGFKINEFALRIMENDELAGFINKIGNKICKEGTVNDFERAVLTQVFENIKVEEKATEVKKEIKESVGLTAFFDKYTMNFF